MRTRKHTKIMKTEQDDIDAILREHCEMVKLLQQAVDAMRITQRLYYLGEGHLLISKCRDIETWLDNHQG